MPGDGRTPLELERLGVAFHHTVVGTARQRLGGTSRDVPLDFPSGIAFAVDDGLSRPANEGLLAPGVDPVGRLRHEVADEALGRLNSEEKQAENNSGRYSKLHDHDVSCRFYSVDVRE